MFTLANELSSVQIDNSRQGASFVISAFDVSGVGNISTGFELPNNWLSIWFEKKRNLSNFKMLLLWDVVV